MRPYTIAVLTGILLLFALLSHCERDIEVMCAKQAQSNGLSAEAAKRACDRL
jgi:hypothetical protein